MKKIGISLYKNKQSNYLRWIRENSNDIEIIGLETEKNNYSDLLKCQGLLLPGGGDVNPVTYKENDDQNVCKEIDDKRDQFELKLLELADKNQIPTLGICRGLQITNVFYGGTLIKNLTGHITEDYEKDGDIYHRLTAVDNSLLYKLTGSLRGIVNSAHHQGVKDLAPGFIATSYSDDNIIESVEMENSKYPFLLVQWHPERMKDREENRFSKEIIKWFINN